MIRRSTLSRRMRISSKRGGSPPPFRHRFGAQIIDTTEKVVSTYFDCASVKGTRACLEHLIATVQVDTVILGVTLTKKPLFEVGIAYSEKQKVRLLADSLILTTVAYRIQLNELHTNLANIRKNQLLHGFEWLCYLISRYVEPTSKQIPALAYLDMTQTLQWIEE